MQGFFLTLGSGLLALVAVAVLVALFEYLRSLRRPQALPVPQQSRAVSVDLDLGLLAETATPAAGDQQQRQATVDQALARMSQGSADQAWIETRPTVLGGTAPTETAR